jgi:glycosyltransferase involved in cell wall biosynthesis
MRCPTLADLPPAAPGRAGWPWRETTPDPPEAAPAQRPWPRISVVTPSLNQGRFLEGCIRSVLLQAYPDLEYIVLDGGSTDGSAAVIRKYDSWLAHWSSQPDDGQAAAVNAGWRRATGEIIGWLNSDDLYCPGALLRVAQEFAADEEAVAVVGGGFLIDGNGRIGSRKAAQRLDLRRALMGYHFDQPTVFLRRRVFHEVGGLDTRLDLAMDWEYWTRLLLHNPASAFRYTEAALAMWRYWPGAKSMRAPAGHNRVVQRLVLGELFDREALPAELRSFRAEAVASTYWLQGHQQRGAGQPLAGLRNVRKAHELAPSRYPWGLGWAIQFWLHAYLRYPLWLVPYWAIRRMRRLARLDSGRAAESGNRH